MISRVRSRLHHLANLWQQGKLKTPTPHNTENEKMSYRQTDINELKRIIADKDHLAVEEKAFQLIKKYPRDEEILKLLCEIFESDWHFRHEDLALSFQYIKNPITAKSLFNVAFSDFEYCRWDDNYPLQRKCTWALADIGTNVAKQFLQEIEKQPNETIASFATKRLKNWDSELIRKGQMLRSNMRHGFNITLEKYSDSINILPQSGQKIIANTFSTKRINITNYSTGEYEQVTEDYIESPHKLSRYFSTLE